MDATHFLTKLNETITEDNASRYATREQHHTEVNDLHRLAIKARELITDQPEPVRVPFIEKTWWSMALRHIYGRNRMRADIRHEYDRRKGLHQTDTAGFRRLVERARRLGPIEETTQRYVGVLAWSIKDEAESKASREGACVQCGALSQEGFHLCTDCGADTEDQRDDLQGPALVLGVYDCVSSFAGDGWFDEAEIGLLSSIETAQDEPEANTFAEQLEELYASVTTL